MIRAHVSGRPTKLETLVDFREPRADVSMGPSELEALVDFLLNLGHVPDPDVTCRLCRALAAMTTAKSVRFS